MRLFISYSSKNRKLVRHMYKLLQEYDNYQPWYDQRSVAGQAWWDEILKQIRQCDVFIFALTPESLASPACQSERDYARALNRPIVPILLKPLNQTLPSDLAPIQYVDGQNLGSQNFVVQLTRALQEVPTNPLPNPLPAPPPSPTSLPIPRNKFKYLPLVLGFAALLALVNYLFWGQSSDSLHPSTVTSVDSITDTFILATTSPTPLVSTDTPSMIPSLTVRRNLYGVAICTNERVANMQNLSVIFALGAGEKYDLKDYFSANSLVGCVCLVSVESLEAAPEGCQAQQTTYIAGAGNWSTAELRLEDEVTQMSCQIPIECPTCSCILQKDNS